MRTAIPWLLLCACAPASAADQADEDALTQIRKRISESTIPVINADGTPAGPPATPIAAAAAFGGVVLAVGGIGALMLWRRTEAIPLDEEQADPVI